MSQAQAQKKPTVYNPADPHGFHEDDHHGHVIIPWQILLGVLLALHDFVPRCVMHVRRELDVTLRRYIRGYIHRQTSEHRKQLVCARLTNPRPRE